MNTPVSVSLNVSGDFGVPGSMTGDDAKWLHWLRSHKLAALTNASKNSWRVEEWMPGALAEYNWTNTSWVKKGGRDFLSELGHIGPGRTIPEKSKDSKSAKKGGAGGAAKGAAKGK